MIMRYIVIMTMMACLFAGCKAKKSNPPVAAAVHHAMNEIELSDQQIQLGNIIVDTIGDKAMGDEVLLNATLNFDQQKTSSVSARVGGRIEHLYFKNPGDYVTKGAKLFDLYSEALNNAKQEYLLALEKQQTLDNPQIDFAQLVQAARNKLLLWGMSGAQVAELAKSKRAGATTAFYSNEAGSITGLDVKEGDYVPEGGTVLRLADLSVLWAEAQVYASQLSFLDTKSQALVRFPGLPGLLLKGRIEFVNPEISPGSRINLVRISLPNSGGLLKPGMQATVTLESPQYRGLSLPAEAVLRDSRGALVWIATGGNTFQYRTVATGVEDNDRVEIKSGLEPGDRVVVSGAYLLNSEYIFRNGTSPL